jgi:hypothetical protein
MAKVIGADQDLMAALSQVLFAVGGVAEEREDQTWIQ